ncbi:fructose-specific PTS transporter subunit EIIC [Alkalibacterium sp. m-11]
MKIVAITSCSTGIAHTFMAAESLEMAAKESGVEIKVETQGSIGTENALTKGEIQEADAVIIAASTTVNKDRFIGKKLLEVDVNEAINDPKDLIERASRAPLYKNKEIEGGIGEETVQGKGIYSHLMTGVSYMIPFVVAGGVLIALAFAVGGINAEGELAAAINELGGVAMGLMLPVLGGYVAFSIADRPGLVPGMVAGMLSADIQAGFIGALLGGFLAGYTIRGLRKIIKLPPSFSGIIPVLILPVLSVLSVGLVMKFVVGIPLIALNNGLINWLNGLSGMNSILLGLILGGMMAIDLAGPIGKAAYFFGVASLTSLSGNDTSQIMAAVMAAGMVPPLAMALSSTLLGKKYYSKQEKEAGKSAWVLGLSFISEGAIPFAAADPVRVLLSVTVGSAITGALSMLFNCGIAVPHGGMFIFLIPGAVSNLLLYIIALAVGTLVSGLLITFLKKGRVENVEEGLA